MCLVSAYRRCGMRVVVEDARPLDCVTLCPWGGADSWSHLFACGDEAVFAGLFPGCYLLTLERRGFRPVRLAVGLPPGANVTIRGCWSTRNWRWRPERFHCAFNRKEWQGR